jgi:pimeloyl-ACP methyl ester carboxylesterase
VNFRIFSASLLFLLTFGIISYQNQPDFRAHSGTKPHIVVFVHGVCGVHYHIKNPKQLINFWRDTVSDTYYASHITALRNDPFFYQNQVIQELGLRKIESQDAIPGNSAGAMAYVFDQMYSAAGSTEKRHYYSFGWNGLHSNKEYYKAGVDLFRDLECEVQKYNEIGQNPRITVIGFSHGGNVALNLGAAHQQLFPDSKLHIDQLVLLGTPLHKITYQYINDDLFGTIYNIFSSADRVQRIDLLTPSQFACSKKIQADATFQLPKKLHQIQFKMRRCAKGVVDNPTRFALTQNYKNPAIIRGRSKLLTNVSPGHAELWFFGWALSDYRPDLIIAPLPAASFVPFIIQAANTHSHTNNPDHHFVFDLRPENGRAVLTRNMGNTIHLHGVLPTVDPQELATIKETLWKYKPENYNEQTFQERLQLTYEIADELHYKTA